MKAQLHSPGTAFLALGFVLWASAFTFLYVVFSIGCAFGWEKVMLGPISMLRMLLTAIWILHLGLLVWLCVICWRRFAASRSGTTARFLNGASTAATAAATAATVWLGFALALPAACTPA